MYVIFAHANTTHPWKLVDTHLIDITPHGLSDPASVVQRLETKALVNQLT